MCRSSLLFWSRSINTSRKHPPFPVSAAPIFSSREKLTRFERVFDSNWRHLYSNRAFQLTPLSECRSLCAAPYAELNIHVGTKSPVPTRASEKLRFSHPHYSDMLTKRQRNKETAKSGSALEFTKNFPTRKSEQGSIYIFAGVRRFQ